MNVFNKLLYDLIKYRATVHLIPVQEGLAKIVTTGWLFHTLWVLIQG